VDVAAVTPRDVWADVSANGTSRYLLYPHDPPPGTLDRWLNLTGGTCRWLGALAITQSHRQRYPRHDGVPFSHVFLSDLDRSHGCPGQPRLAPASQFLWMTTGMAAWASC
jgi:hypothetical protein